MNRRAFFRGTLGGFVAAALAPWRSASAVPLTMSDPATGISMRFVRAWKPEQSITRLSVGDTFTFGSRVDPLTRKATGQPQQWVVIGETVS